MKRKLWFSLCLAALLMFAVPVLAGQQMVMSPAAKAGHSPEVTVLANACNPCAKNPCAHKKMANPCNPCAKKNPCNPCGKKAENPCNPCGHKMANPCKGDR